MRVVIGVGLGLAVAAMCAAGASKVQGQSTSPSVRAAARLKYTPPPNWIRHYLPDDRYKLAGGTWKVVSTETDNYYYPAWAPEMLRQSNGIVIGFPSSAAAEEAGYKRSKYPMDSPLLGITGRGELESPAPAAGPMGGFSLPTEGLTANVNKGKAQRVKLADGVSTTILPSGWTHLSQSLDIPQNQQGTVGAQQIKVDYFAPGAITPELARDPKARMIGFAFMQMPSGLNAETLFSPAMASRMSQRMATQGAPSGMSARAGGFGNIRGVVMSVPVPNIGTVPLVFGGKGSKAFILYDGSRNAKGSREVIRSFVGR